MIYDDILPDPPKNGLLQQLDQTDQDQEGEVDQERMMDSHISDLYRLWWGLPDQ
jgi:hypothetical protein